MHGVQDTSTSRYSPLSHVPGVHHWLGPPLPMDGKMHWQGQCLEVLQLYCHRLLFLRLHAAFKLDGTLDPFHNHNSAARLHAYFICGEPTPST
mmetsp:Transcript_4799/g.6611  ORF Transcript_4799/g.6611 Transcript_4799/m.6611 type:complete len:93 (-) Transcript_4799:33-311(-)